MKHINKAEINLLNSVNTEFKDHSVAFRIRRFYTDVLGQIVNKATVPAALQTSFPFCILGEFDRQGGYKKAFFVVPPMPDTFYIGTFVNGCGLSSYTYTGFNPLNTVQGNLLVGDIVHLFTDNLASPNYFIWIVQQSNLVSLASIVANTNTTQKDNKYNRLYVKSVVYNTSNNNEDQWNEAIHLTRVDNIGLAKDDSINPTIWKTPYTYLTGILEIGLNFWVDQFLGLNSYIRFGTEDIQFILKLNK